MLVLVLVDWAWRTVNMLGAWVGRRVGSQASMCARNLDPSWVGRAPGPVYHPTRRLDSRRPGWGTPGFPSTVTVDDSGKWESVGGRTFERVCCR